MCVCYLFLLFPPCLLSIPCHDTSHCCPSDPRSPHGLVPPQDRQLFDTISLLIQGSLEGELKLMEELAGPGGQPSALPPARSLGGSDPQVTVPLCRAGLCHAVLCFWGGGGVSCPLGIWRKSSLGASVELWARREAARGLYKLRSTSGIHIWNVGMLRTAPLGVKDG